MAIGEQVQRLKTSWIWLAILGVISLVGGFLALTNPFAATFAAVLLAGSTFLLFGALQIVQAFRVREWSGFLSSLLLGVITLAVGLSLLTNPVAGALSLTVLVAILLVLGIVEISIVSRCARSPLDFCGGVQRRLDHSRLHDPVELPLRSGFGARHSAGDRVVVNGVFLLMVAFGLRGA